MYYDLKNNAYFEKKDSKSLKFLYNTILGRGILKVLIKKPISNLYAKYMNSSLSKYKINSFIKKNNINMDEYKHEDYKSFNDFFIRNIKENKRRIDSGLIAICDSKLSVYKIGKDSTINIKNSIYSIEELIKEKNKYKYALVFRLAVDDYHHYVFPDDGKIIKSKCIDGVLHTVQPIAFKRYKVFHENQREVTFLECKNLGNICYIEVGALFVGKIVNEDKKTFKKGEEKGHFEFGGSTIVMLVEKDLNINKTIIENTNNDIETIVKLGQRIN
jgi:phosphatidylserine decarboxylase